MSSRLMKMFGPPPGRAIEAAREAEKRGSACSGVLPSV
jgi:hypothetical protein